MYELLLLAISCLCVLQGGVFSEECSWSVFGKRETFFAPAGSSLSLSCLVQHCGSTWTGSWIWENFTSSNSTAVKDSARHRLTKVPLNPNRTKLHLTIVKVFQSDEGFYRCKVIWSNNIIELSHWMQVNITKGVAFQRKFFHRVLVCSGALLCLPVILGLARCLSSEVKSQPHPRIEVLYAAVQKDRSNQPPQPPPRCPVPKKRTAPPQRAPQTSQQKPELLYADISQDASRKQERVRRPTQTTVYSSVRFSR